VSLFYAAVVGAAGELLVCVEEFGGGVVELSDLRWRMRLRWRLR
jgi:hypothetical protein